MPWVRFGVANVEIDGAVRAMLGLYPYLEPAYEKEIAEIIAADWPAFCSRARYLRQFPHIFSAYGRESISHSIKATRGFMIFAVWKTVFDGSEHIWGQRCSNVELRASVKECCSTSKGHNGVVITRKDRPQLPLAGCDAEWCSCRWFEVDDRQIRPA